ncbi:MAG: cytochrome c oxidase subunit II [Nitrospinae bacterium]|nr:cytochrome c oxidase subunit II [Nitrospinota bacterium]
MLRWLPENISTYGGDIDSVFALIYYIVGFWFVLTWGVLLLFILRYRRRAGRRASYVRGERLAEAAWLFVPAFIVTLLDLGIDISGAKVWQKIKGPAPASEVAVRTTAKQFNWEILYPGPDGQFGTADDLLLENELHVPVNKVVQVTLASKDVIHSFFLPNVRLKQDAVPGRDIPVWFEATKPGRYEIPCAELCGFGHSGMKGYLIVHSPQDYQHWVTAHWPTRQD